MKPDIIFEAEAAHAPMQLSNVLWRTNRLYPHADLLEIIDEALYGQTCGSPILCAKASDGTVTRTGVLALGDADRREEIARMLSGAAITDEARAQADRLLEGV